MVIRIVFCRDCDNPKINVRGKCGVELSRKPCNICKGRLYIVDWVVEETGKCEN